jgi:peptidoglycan/xylan/chitin deacetylase (PgdA/CDA1 family)
MRNRAPFISFTFDDFPRSAWLTGGAILKRFGLAGTYYVSLGMVGKDSPSGAIFLLDDLKDLVAGGHELGCHTFAHCHSWETRPELFEESVIENERVLGVLLPGEKFRTLAYPISWPRPQIKQRVAKHFVCCRGGDQMFNIGLTDLNNLYAYHLDWRNRNDFESVRHLIDRNRREAGWLIFVTHDVGDPPSRFGCATDFFEGVVRHAVDSGATILPVTNAWDAIRTAES